MKALGNVLWFICGGFLSACAWYLYGFLWCITIIGIPLGKQCFKFARLSLMPFDKKVVNVSSSAIGCVANLFWIIFTGWEMALANLLLGVTLCVTIVGIPFGLQYFKLAKLSLTPFGFKVVNA